MPVGKSSLARAAETVAAKNEEKKKNPAPKTAKETPKAPQTPKKAPADTTAAKKIERPKSDREAMPTVVLNEEMVPSAEVSRPAELPTPAAPLPGRVPLVPDADPKVGVLDPQPDPQVTPFIPIGGELPTHLL
ncbi:MAG: hypothetical protein J6125_03920 [Clostridia bacterium]|nr:hypothetical protein [Clostridia bacterium]